MVTDPSNSAALWRPPDDVDPDGQVPWRALVALVAAAAAVRAVGLGRDLWLDEVFTLVDVVRRPMMEIVTHYSSDNLHLLYAVAARASVALLGESAVALRLPAVLFGLASVVAAWRLARWVGGRREALIVAALLAFSYHHVWFSQNARGYTGLLFATVLGTELFLRGLAGGRWRTWVAYAAVLALGMGLHLTMIFVAAAHGLVALGLLARAGSVGAGRGRVLGALALSAALTLLVYAPTLTQIAAFYLRPSGGTTTAAVVWKNPLWLVAETIRGLGVGLAFGVVGVAGAALLFGAGVWSVWRRSPTATVLFILPALLGGVTLVALGRNLWPRFFFNELAFAGIFAVRGARVIGDTVARAWRRRAGDGAIAPPRLGLAVAVALVAASALTLPRNARLPKQDFSGAREFVLARRGPADRVVALDLAAEAYRRYHAAPSHNFAYAKTLEELEVEEAAAGRTWVLYTLTHHLKAARPELWRAVEERYETVRVFPGTLGDGAVVVALSRDDRAPHGD